MACPRPTRCALVLAPLAVCFAVGCRSYQETDLVERELRWQENQIYALEDYLMEYQAKVRRLREENASLAQALAECEQPDGRSPREKSTRRRPTRETHREELPPLQLDEPSAPSAEPALSPEGGDEPDGEDIDIPPVPLPEMPADDVPDVPTTWLGPPPLKVVEVNLPWIIAQEAPEQEFDVAADADKPGEELVASDEPPRPWIDGGLAEDASDPEVDSEPEQLLPTDDQEVILASIRDDQIEPLDAAPTDDAKYLDEPMPTDQAAWLLTQTDLTREADSDAQVLRLRVTPMSADDRPAHFDGEVSIMLRDPAVSGPAGRLARWDFAPDMVREKWDRSGRDGALSFSLPLDEPLAPDQPVAVWVRLSPADSAQEQILDHLTLRLESRRRKSPVDLEGGKWAVALPGQPALLDGPQSRVTSAWRTAEAVPVRTSR